MATRPYHFIFATRAEARAFLEGVEFVHDSSLTVQGIEPTAQGVSATVLEARDDQEQAPQTRVLSETSDPSEALHQILEVHAELDETPAGDGMVHHALEELVRRAMDRRASAVCAEGPLGQLAFLLEEDAQTPEEVLEALAQS